MAAEATVMPRRNTNAGSGSDHGGGIQHNRNGQSGGGDFLRNLEFQLHTQWNEFRAQTTSAQRRSDRRAVQFNNR